MLATEARRVATSRIARPARCPVRELVVSVPAPRRDHREHEVPALAHERSISTRVALAHVLGRMGQVELDGATATRLEVDEHQPVLRAEDVPGMWLAVQQLLGRAAVADRVSQVSEGARQELSVLVGERRRAVSARNEPLGLRDSIREVRRRDVEPSHALMQPLEGMRVVGWRDVSCGVLGS